ncbi:MAG: hypothetical protein ACP5HU_08290 [Phycisphaerae bacterium]
MEVFLAGIIQGSLTEAAIHPQDWREPVREALSQCLNDARVYCHYSEHPDSITYELPDIRRTLQEGLDRAADCDLLIAYLPSASMGTALEMYVASAGGAVVVTITPMSANWVVRAYSDAILPDIEAFEEFCRKGKLSELLEADSSQ